MTMHESKLEKREEIANGTMAFHFEKPVGFTFKPGQAIDVLLAQAPGTDAQSMRHTFSIVSAPFENELIIATRMRDSTFKRALRALPTGERVAIDGPSGSLVLHKDRGRPAVFIAGGIGITPFMSMLRQSARDRLDQRQLLLYSNRRPEDAAFLPELQQIAQQNRSFRLVATMTQMGGSRVPPGVQTGLIDAALLTSVTVDLTAPIYYVAGPPALVEGMRQVLEDMGIDDIDIRSEDFYGY